MSLRTATFSLLSDAGTTPDFVDTLRFAMNQEVRKELDAEPNDLRALFIPGLCVTVCGPFS